ncbi:MAG: bifunctional class I SAM-dependent methyltransferase/glycosyltransferase family 2 protein [Spirochaetota bacterium]|nr:bifunctional class I SAM-dependent methyltransferase/glycosyltransferase family 2 protein [Spirochaetota bacterium]
MKHLFWIFLLILSYFIVETLRPVLIPPNLSLFKIPLINVIWAALGLLALIGYILVFIMRRKEIRDARLILKTGTNHQEKLTNYFNAISKQRDIWKKRASYYYEQLLSILKFLIPRDARLIEIGCGTGDLLKAIPSKHCVGVDMSTGMLDKAREKYPDIPFEEMKAEELDSQKLGSDFDYVLMSDIVGHLSDVQGAFEESKKLMHENSRLIVTYFNYLWEPILRLMEKLYLKMPQARQNWLSGSDIKNLIELSDMEIVKKSTAFMMPFYIPVISAFFNKVLVRLPLFRHLGIIQYYVVRRKVLKPVDYSISIVVPARNEAGNIEDAVLRTPDMGKYTELIFVEGNSTDDTWDEIQRVYEKYKNTRRIKIMRQPGKGKGDAVRKGFQEASGDIVTILDADLTMPPEELPKFFNVLARGQADFANGCRLVYPMEDQAMRFFNVLGNKFFSMAFTWLLDQPIKDTLCGTKLLLKKDYEHIVANRSYFGDFDPFGDFDLIFGASKLNMKIVDVPITYKARTYGSTNINRWSHGWLLLKMVLFALRKIKFI